ncbi:CoA transferase [Gammaproteobacteria bacterium]|nr:CoA transferase [Gammaproteobacteria bacterium]
MPATGPLADLKVIELAHIMAGPVCGQLLADMGADVIKVEKVPGGDDTRRMVPPQIDGESAAYMILNRNKRGAAINMKSTAGKAVLLKMLGEADVVIENFRVGTMERLGLGYDSLHELNPALIYCQITGFGRSGPYADRAGFDLIAQGMSGLMSVTGEGPDHPPIKAGVPVGDMSAGMLAAMGILAAYIHRLKTGEGQLVDTSLLEASIVNTAWVSAIFFATAVSPGALGSAHPLAAPYQALQTRDGWVNVGAANQANWLRLVEVVGEPELATDPRFVDNSVRMQNLPELIGILTQSFKQRDTTDWLARLQSVGVPASPVLSIGDMLKDPQVLAREMVVDVEHSHLGKTKALGSPVKFSETPTNIRHGAPLLGEHTREILAEFGYSSAEIDALVASGDVIAV